MIDCIHFQISRYEETHLQMQKDLDHANKQNRHCTSQVMFCKAYKAIDIVCCIGSVEIQNELYKIGVLPICGYTIYTVIYGFSINQLVDYYKSCILIG